MYAIIAPQEFNAVLGPINQATCLFWSQNDSYSSHQVDGASNPKNLSEIDVAHI